MAKVIFASAFCGIFILLEFVNTVNLSNSESEISASKNDSSQRKLSSTTISDNMKDIHFIAYTDPLTPDFGREVVIGDTASLANSGLKPGRVILLADGFLERNSSVVILKNAYLKRGFTNIVYVDYTKLANSILPDPFSLGTYGEALENVPIIGFKIAKFIYFLFQNNIIRGGKQIQMIGYSLGAHVFSSTGRFMQKRYGMTAGRLTGLDTAGPFADKLGEDKLNKSYARFVSGIHTDIDLLGTPERLGHADFFINGGKGGNIPGCKEREDPLSVASCGHGASVVFYMKTIQGKSYYGCRCKSAFKKLCIEDKNNCTNRVIVGDRTPSETRGRFYVSESDDLNPELYIPGFNISYAQRTKEAISQMLKFIESKNSETNYEP